MRLFGVGQVRGTAVMRLRLLTYLLFTGLMPASIAAAADPETKLIGKSELELIQCIGAPVFAENYGVKRVLIWQYARQGRGMVLFNTQNPYAPFVATRSRGRFCELTVTMQKGKAVSAKAKQSGKLLFNRACAHLVRECL